MDAQVNELAHLLSSMQNERVIITHTTQRTPMQEVRRVLAEALPPEILVATNIGSEQIGRSTACQAALGVALAGADIIKLGLAKMPLGEAQEFGPALIRTVRKWFPTKKCAPVLFADERLARWYIDPLKDGPDLAAHMKTDGLVVDTLDKGIGMGLLDYYQLGEIEEFAAKCHDRGLEACCHILHWEWAVMALKLLHHAQHRSF